MRRDPVRGDQSHFRIEPKWRLSQIGKKESCELISDSTSALLVVDLVRFRTWLGVRGALTANRSGGFSSRETHRTQRGRSVQPRVFVGSRPTPTRRARPKKRRCPQAGIHPKPSQPPHAHHPWFLHRGSSTNIGIGPRPPFQRPDVGRHRADRTKRQLTRTAGLQLEHS